MPPLIVRTDPDISAATLAIIPGLRGPISLGSAEALAALLEVGAKIITVDAATWQQLLAQQGP